KSASGSSRVKVRLPTRPWLTCAAPTRRLHASGHRDISTISGCSPSTPGRVLVPVLQLNDEGDLDKAVSSIIVRPLLKAGARPWTVWAWSTRPTGLFSGRVPAALVHEKPEVVEEAVNV